MNRRKKYVSTTGLAVVAIAMSPNAAIAQNGVDETQLSDRSIAVIPDRNFDGGEGGCADYGANFLQTTFSDFFDEYGGGCDFPVNGIDCDFDFQDNTLSFDSANFPINYVVLEHCIDGGEFFCDEAIVNVHYYPAGGISSDDNITVQVPLDSPVVPDVVHFCYGQSGASAPALGSEVPTCSFPTACGSAPSDQFLLDVTDLRDESGDPATILPQEENNDCVCNASPLPQCDPAIPAPAAGACPEEQAETAQVSTNWERSNDPYFCRTIGGRRQCWSY